jgi:very-short-patch-repair endonuclease
MAMQRHSKLTRRKSLNAASGHRARGPEEAAAGKVWALLRDAPVAGLKFGRRVPLGPYVVAFACPAARLVIEIGEEDAVKAAWFADHGYRLLTFAAAELQGNPQRVAAAVRQAFEIRSVPRG